MLMAAAAHSHWVRRPHVGVRRAQNGDTALIWAAANGHADCARLLLDAGADKNTADVVRRRVQCARRHWHCGGGDERLLCEALCHLHFCFHFSFLAFL